MELYDQVLDTVGAQQLTFNRTILGKANCTMTSGNNLSVYLRWNGIDCGGWTQLSAGLNLNKTTESMIHFPPPPFCSKHAALRMVTNQHVPKITCQSKIYS